MTSAGASRKGQGTPGGARNRSIEDSRAPADFGSCATCRYCDSEHGPAWCWCSEPTEPGWTKPNLTCEGYHRREARGE